MQSSALRWLGIVLLIAAADYLSGRLGLLLALPPGFATAVWPPSGIALAAVLLWGYGVTPGVWLGSFALNIFIAAQAGPITDWTSAAVIASSIAAGSTLQAVIGTWLIKRFVGFPTALLFEKDIAIFLLLGGPLSCMTAATIGIGTLIVAGIMPIAAAYFQWWTWWIGDTIGVLVMMPLLMIAFAKPRDVWRERLYSVGFTLLLAFAITITFFVYASHTEQARIQKISERQNEVMAAAIRNSLDRKLDLLQMAGGVFEASDHVSRAEFHQLSTHILSRQSGIQAIEWSPRVAQNQRADLEKSARADGHEHFQFSELNQGSQQVAKLRQEYFPVYFLEPLQGNQTVLGYDMGSDPVRREMFEQAMRSGTAVSSRPIKLIQETDRQHGVLVAYPVYRGLTSPNTVDERRAHLAGYVVMVLRIGDLVTEALKSLSVPDTIVALDDASANLELLAPQLANQTHADNRNLAAAGSWSITPIEFGSHHWLLRLAPTAAAAASQRSLIAWTVLAGGMLFSSFLGAFLLAVTGRITHVKKLLREREQAEEHSRLIVEAAPNALIMVNRDGTITMTNAQAERMFGYSRAELIGQSIDKLVPVNVRHHHPAQRSMFLSAPKTRPMGVGRDLYCVTKEGKELPVEISLTPIETPEGMLILTSIVDITERKHSEILSRSAQANVLRQSILDSIPFSIIAVDTEGTIITVNPSSERMLGYSREELVGQNADKIINIQKENDLAAKPKGQEADLPVELDYKALVAKASLGMRNERELAYRHKDGSLLPVHLTITPLKDDAGKINGFLEVAYDITERKRTEAHILHMAHHDSLTGLPNRVLLMDRIEMGIKRALRANNHLGVLMIDLDHFKRVNDSLGHHVGDHLLKAVSERILTCVRGADTVARMGGDEFVVILPDLADAASAEKVTRKIIDAVAAPMIVGAHELTVTPSIGISIYPEDGNDANSLLKNADAAMYWAKSSGRYGYQSFSREMERAASEKMAVEMSLRRALRENELCLYYQPQISISSGAIVGFEALMRWNDPVGGGVIYPDQFIAVAEETGLIVPIGEWVLRAACHDAKFLQEYAGRPLMIAINLSARQFREGNLPQLVQTVLMETGLKPTSLELEITESMLIDNQDEVSTRLHALRSLGISVAVDDFGTGFSSLSYLTQFPISTLKIDRSFINKMIGSKSDTAVVQAIVAIAKSMDLKVIAEGVETTEQLQYLLKHIFNNEDRPLDPGATNVDPVQVQGYLVSAALPLSRIENEFQNIHRRSKALVHSGV